MVSAPLEDSGGEQVGNVLSLCCCSVVVVTTTERCVVIRLLFWVLASTYLHIFFLWPEFGVPVIESVTKFWCTRDQILVYSSTPEYLLGYQVLEYRSLRKRTWLVYFLLLDVCSTISAITVVLPVPGGPWIKKIFSLPTALTTDFTWLLFELSTLVLFKMSFIKLNAVIFGGLILSGFKKRVSRCYKYSWN